MFDLNTHRVVDLSPRMVARIKRLNGDIEEGKPDMFGLPWILEEGVAEYDDTLFTWIGGWKGDKVWPVRISGHFGSHTEGGKGHLDHWEGLPDNVLGVWEYPLETFMGPAAVCDLTPVKPIEGENDKGEKIMKGQDITPDHLSNVQTGDIVLMWSPYRGSEMPVLPGDTANWLADRKIKMLAIEMPGVAWETHAQGDQPNNSLTHRAMLGNNIPITYPLVNVSTLTKDRVFYIGLPLSVEQLEATWIRAVAFEEK